MAANNTTSMMSNLSTTTPFDISVYTCSHVGLILPAISEYTWSKSVRIFLYLIGMLWCFLGVAILADVFMCSIEKITSKTAKVRVPDANESSGFRIIRVKVWNNTVANLSLLALGTSAPEILLSCIEIIFNNFEAGELGPSTIVGSAAFNLLVISGICIVCIPDGEVRRVKSMKVFAVTSFCCIWAYVWLIIVLIVWTPNIVTIEEAVLTLLMFPALILVAYLADRGFCLKKKELEHEQPSMVGFKMHAEKGDEESQALDKDSDDEDNAEIMRLCKELGHDVKDEGLPPEEAAQMAARKMTMDQSHDHLWYRINATRTFGGRKKLIPRVLGTFQEIYDHIQTPEEERGDLAVTKKKDHSEGGTRAVVEFTAAETAVLESEKRVRIGIRRHGKVGIPCTVRIETLNGTAVAHEDYIPFDQEVKFAENEELRQVYIEIVDDNEWEPDEFFFVKLHVPKTDSGEEQHVTLGNMAITQVIIINDDEPGKLEFQKPSIIAQESGRKVRVPVVRTGGADGHVSVKWSTKDISAVSGADYEGSEGELKFDHGETIKTIDIVIHDSKKKERDESFQITLGDCDGGAVLGKITKTIVTIVIDEEFNGLVSRIMNLTKANMDALQIEESSYPAQFVEALNVNGGDLQGATVLDYIMHFMTFFWKVLFAFIPPCKYLGGWPTFLISLAVIGFMTAIIGDLAGIFGCLIDIPNSITAITFVALGTSMPDTFASKTAAINEKNADSSVGNINGSNSVNVFLGLGLPWTFAAIYHAVKTGGSFKVNAGSLGFSVVIYTACAVIAIGLLVLRRFTGVFGNAELGGPKIPKIICGIIFVCLWLFYIVMSSLQSKGVIKGF